MKLSLEALKNRAEKVTTENIMNSITGGVENSCHNRVNDFLDWLPGSTNPIKF